MRDENNELPGDFLHELYKWALECKHLITPLRLSDPNSSVQKSK